jgi:hypothetical protein
MVETCNEPGERMKMNSAEDFVVDVVQYEGYNCVAVLKQECGI